MLDAITTGLKHSAVAFLHIQNFMLFYSVSLFSVYALLYIVAVRPFRNRLSLHAIDSEPVGATHLYKPVTLILPAYNEEKVIVDCVRTALKLEYPSLEVVVVCDGPKDRTFEVMVESFNLKATEPSLRQDIKTKPIKKVMVNPAYPNLRVILKENGGKADALNVGINAARSPLVCCCDADTLIESDALYRLARPFRDNPATIAAAGALALTNGAEFDGGRLVRNSAPGNWLARVQTVEYIRAFYFGRMGFEALGAMLLISGAFGLFDRHAIVSAGGYYTGTQGEDMELVVRLHRYCYEHNRQYEMAYVPDAVAWTEAPEDLKSLKGQRMRWQRGLCETLWRHRKMAISPGMGTPSWLGYTYFMLYEGLAPLIELTGYTLTIVLGLMGLLAWQAVVAMTVFAISASLLATFAALYEQQLLRPIFTQRSDLGKIMLAVILELVAFRPIGLIWRTRAIWQILTRKKIGWGTLERKGFLVK